jgi:hypothetical protein
VTSSLASAENNLYPVTAAAWLVVNTVLEAALVCTWCTLINSWSAHTLSNPPQNQSSALRLQSVNRYSDLIRTLQYSAQSQHKHVRCMGSFAVYMCPQARAGVITRNAQLVAPLCYLITDRFYLFFGALVATALLGWE